MSDILERIYEAKAAAADREEAQLPYEVLRLQGRARVQERRPFLQAVRNAEGPAIIGEIKRASPSAGLIARNFDPAGIARGYAASGADCISVLTEADHFLGDLSYLEIARCCTTLPILRKDFLSRPYQIAQSAAYGADAVLLIVAGLRDEELLACTNEAASYALDVFVEVHNAAELERALALNLQFVGINNRDLRTFETDLAVSEYLLPRVPTGITVVSESGMRGPGDIARLYAAGARGFLVGELLMRADDPGATLRALKGAVRAPATR